MIFQGKEMAGRMERELKRRIEKAEEKLGRRLKLVSLVNGENEAGVKYTSLKKGTAQRLGVEFAIFDVRSKQEAAGIIKAANEDAAVDGIMLQLPFDGSGELIPLIDPKKDVDGLRDDSGYMPAAVRAVREILDRELGIRDYGKVLVVGSRGMVGRGLLKWLDESRGMDKEDFDLEKLKAADVIVSCTGQAGLISPGMVKEGAAAIDLGYPMGDFDPAVADKASFFTPVPGGVGPVTVVSLFANLAEGLSSSQPT